MIAGKYVFSGITSVFKRTTMSPWAALTPEVTVVAKPLWRRGLQASGRERGKLRWPTAVDRDGCADRLLASPWYDGRFLDLHS